MMVQARTREVSNFSPFGVACIGSDLRLERGYAYSTRPSPSALFVSGAVAPLKSYTGCFGWRLTDRQAGALYGH